MLIHIKTNGWQYKQYKSDCRTSKKINIFISSKQLNKALSKNQFICISGVKKSFRY